MNHENYEETPVTFYIPYLLEQFRMGSNGCKKSCDVCCAFDTRYDALTFAANGSFSGQLLNGGCDCTGLCRAIHAEEMVLARLLDYEWEPHAILSTTAPCRACTLKLLGSRCQEVYYLNEDHDNGKALWIAEGRKWMQIKNI